MSILYNIAEMFQLLYIGAFIRILFFAALLWMGAISQVYAADSLTRTKLNDADFGTCIAPATPNNAPALQMAMGTNGVISYPGAYTGSGTGTVAAILVTGPLGREIRVSCETAGQLNNATGCCGQANRVLNPARFVIGTANAVGPNLGTACAGTGTSPVTHFLTGVAAQDTILVAGRVRVDDVRIGGQYTTVGADSIDVRIRDQTGGANGPLTVVNFDFMCESPNTFCTTQDMLFGTIDFTVIGAADRANLATNSTMTYAGSFSGPAAGTAGFATVESVENGVTLEVYCDTTATLAHAGGGTIQVTNLEVDPEDSLGAIGTGSACNGTAGAPAMTFVFNDPTRDTIYFGGRLNGSTAASFGSGGNFSTANAGGDNIEMIVLNQ